MPEGPGSDIRPWNSGSELTLRFKAPVKYLRWFSSVFEPPPFRPREKIPIGFRKFMDGGNFPPTLLFLRCLPLGQPFLYFLYHRGANGNKIVKYLVGHETLVQPVVDEDILPAVVNDGKSRVGPLV